jgi:hypothetical protein
VKVVSGPVWQGKLLGFVSLFAQRRSDFEFALTIHTARAVDAANQTLGVVDRTTQEMKSKMDKMIEMFQRFVLPGQKELEQFIEKKGGAKACRSDDKVLKEVSEFEKTQGGPGSSSLSSSAVGSLGGRKAETKSDLDDLKTDLNTDPEVAIQKNMAGFLRKFEIQKNQITEELSKAMRREGDRVISAVTSGPHDRIIDPVCSMSQRTCLFD